MDTLLRVTGHISIHIYIYMGMLVGGGNVDDNWGGWVGGGNVNDNEVGGWWWGRWVVGRIL